jgi:hypothetical protein
MRTFEIESCFDESTGHIELDSVGRRALHEANYGKLQNLGSGPTAMRFAGSSNWLARAIAVADRGAALAAAISPGRAAIDHSAGARVAALGRRVEAADRALPSKY